MENIALLIIALIVVVVGAYGVYCVGFKNGAKPNRLCFESLEDQSEVKKRAGDFGVTKDGVLFIKSDYKDGNSFYMPCNRDGDDGYYISDETEVTLFGNLQDLISAMQKAKKAGRTETYSNGRETEVFARLDTDKDVQINLYGYTCTLKPNHARQFAMELLGLCIEGDNGR
jgi:hypothetical protein